MDQNEIPFNVTPLVEIAEEVANGIGFSHANEFEGGEGRDLALGAPSWRLVDVVLDLFLMRMAVDEYLLDAVHGQELEGILNYRNIRKREKTLARKTR